MKAIYDFVYSAECIVTIGIIMLLVAAVIKYLADQSNPEKVHPYKLENQYNLFTLFAIFGSILIIIYILIKLIHFSPNE